MKGHLKVTQGHHKWCKAIYHVLLLIGSNIFILHRFHCEKVMATRLFCRWFSVGQKK